MTEMQALEQCKPEMVSMILEAQKMTADEYRAWKREMIEDISNTKVRGLMKKIFEIIDIYLSR